MYVYGSFGITHIIYWLAVAVFSILDLQKNPKAVNKLSTRPKDVVDKNRWFQVCKNQSNKVVNS